MGKSILSGLAAALVLAAGDARAQVPGVDFYLGGGIGQSNADISAGDLEVPEFDKKDFAWKLFGGVRFASMFGAELEYIDFGKPKGSDAELKYKGFAGYGLIYVPLPLPILDIYVKAGLARIDADGETPDFSINTDDTKFSFGAGVQLKLGSLAIRGEYQQFKLEDSKPSLLSVSFAKSFL